MHIFAHELAANSQHLNSTFGYRKNKNPISYGRIPNITVHCQKLKPSVFAEAQKRWNGITYGAQMTVYTRDSHKDTLHQFVGARKVRAQEKEDLRGREDLLCSAFDVHGMRRWK